MKKTDDKLKLDVAAAATERLESLGAVNKAYAEQDELEHRLKTVRQANDAAAKYQRGIEGAAAELREKELEAKVFHGELVFRDEHGALHISCEDGCHQAMIHSPEAIESLYQQIKKALNK